MRVIASRYELRQLLGRGGMGEVWQAHDRTIARTVAVKLMPLDVDGRDGTDVFVREARAAGGLRHPGVVTIHDVGVDEAEKCLFLVMEHVAGRDLAEVLHADRPRPVAEVLDWAGQVAGALDAAHTAGIVHRDLKPANLMLTEGGRIVVLDFGIARFLESSTRSSRVLGTLGYMAPERFDGQAGDGRSDLYALGCIVYELLTGELPFQANGPIAMMRAHLEQSAPPVSRKRTGVPPALDALVRRLLAKDPQDRPATAGEVRQRLHDIASGVDAEDDGSTVTQAAEYPRDAAAEATEKATKKGTKKGVEKAAKSETAAAPDTVAKAQTEGEAAGQAATTAALSRRRVLTIAGAAAAVLGAGAGAVAYVERSAGPKPTLKWRAAVGRLNQSPVVADGVVYAGSTDGNLYAIDAATGAKKWNFRTAESIDSSPAVATGSVYVGGADGKLYAIDIATGAQRWKFDTGAGINGCAPVLASTAASTLVYISNAAGTVYAVDAADGSLAFSAQIGGASQANMYRLAFSDGDLYVPGTDHRLYALDGEHGVPQWVKNTNSYSSPVLADGVLYLTNEYGALHALDPATGAEKWNCTPPMVHGTGSIERLSVGDPLVNGNRAYLVADAPCAIDLGTGTMVWQYTDVADGVFDRSLVLAGGVLYAHGNGRLLALDAATGTESWSSEQYAGNPGAMTDADTLVVSSAQLVALTLPKTGH